MSNPICDAFRPSRLMVGTVQLGMPYGVANQVGQPSYSDALAIIAAALEGGVNCFDTAAAYGTSEEVLGRALHELKVADQVLIVTKIRPLTTDELADAELARRAIEQSIEESRRRLGLDCLPVVLFHREPDARYVEILESLRARGWLRHIGVSCDNHPGPASEFATSGQFAALQIPGNVLDRRHQQSGIFEEADSRGVAIFLRSVYLQGLLVMPEATIPGHLRAILEPRRKLKALADQAGIGLEELALRYPLAQRGITSILTGVETVDQVRKNLAMIERGPLPDDFLNAISAVVPNLPESLLTPSQWPALAATAAEPSPVSTP